MARVTSFVRNELKQPTAGPERSERVRRKDAPNKSPRFRKVLVV